MRLLSDEEIAFAWHSEFWRSGLKLVYLLVSFHSPHLLVVAHLAAQNRYLPFAVVGTGIYANWRDSSTPPFVMLPSVSRNLTGPESVNSPSNSGVSVHIPVLRLRDNAPPRCRLYPALLILSIVGSCWFLLRP